MSESKGHAEAIAGGVLLVVAIIVIVIAVVIVIVVSGEIPCNKSWLFQNASVRRVLIFFLIILYFLCSGDRLHTLHVRYKNRGTQRYYTQ